MIILKEILTEDDATRKRLEVIEKKFCGIQSFVPLLKQSVALQRLESLVVLVFRTGTNVFFDDSSCSAANTSIVCHLLSIGFDIIVLLSHICLRQTQRFPGTTVFTCNDNNSHDTVVSSKRCILTSIFYILPHASIKIIFIDCASHVKNHLFWQVSLERWQLC